MWNLIPQAFYDLLARILPGAILIIASACVFLSPGVVSTFVFASPESMRLFTFGPMLLWGLLSYTTGFLITELWELTIGRILERTGRKNEDEWRKESLEEHNRLRRADGREPLSIDVTQFPRVSVMRDHLRHVTASEAARLLKVRAERRLCQVLIIGLGGLAIVNICYLIAAPTIERAVMECAMALAVIACVAKACRLYKQFTIGTCVAWLATLRMNAK
jgi:hypothetical protein